MTDPPADTADIADTTHNVIALNDHPADTADIVDIVPTYNPFIALTDPPADTAEIADAADIADKQCLHSTD